MDRAIELNERTSVPLFWVVGAGLTIAPMLIGGILWLAAIDTKAQAAQDEIRDLRALVQQINSTVFDVHERVIRIEQHQKDQDQGR